MVSPAAVLAPESRAVSDMHFSSVMVDFLVSACVFVLKYDCGQEAGKSWARSLDVRYVGINTNNCAGT